MPQASATYTVAVVRIPLFRMRGAFRPAVKLMLRSSTASKRRQRTGLQVRQAIIQALEIQPAPLGGAKSTSPRPAPVNNADIRRRRIVYYQSSCSIGQRLPRVDRR
jgi:hypothetical protein